MPKKANRPPITIPTMTGLQLYPLDGTAAKPLLTEGRETALARAPRAPPMASQVRKKTTIRMTLLRLLLAISVYMCRILRYLGHPTLDRSSRPQVMSDVWQRSDRS